MRERLYRRLLWAAVATTLACGSSPGPAPAPDPSPSPATGGTGGNTPAPPVGPPPSTPQDAAPIAVPTDAAPPADAGAPPAAAPDAAGALGPFPMAALKAAKPSLYVSAGTHLEGPSWRNGDLFFAADGGGWGLMRVDANRKLYRYHPGLTPIGTTLLADG